MRLNAPIIVDVSDKQVSSRDIGSYGVSEASHYLRLPKATIRAWVMGQAKFQPVIKIPTPSGPPLLSFVNLVEVHVLGALRRRHNIPLPQVRRALRLLQKWYPESHHPLADLDLTTDGFELFVEEVGKLVSATADGQFAIRKLLEAHLMRVDKDVNGAPLRLFPFTRKPRLEDVAQEPRMVVIDPTIAFGRPVLFGTGIPTEVIADRYKAGESISELAKDYGRQREEIEEAIRCELPAAA